MRFKVYNDYKLKLKAYSKKRFDPFCRWERITVPYDEEKFMETTIGQLNFFKWAIENKIVDYIEQHYAEIEEDMNMRNSTSKKRTPSDTESTSSSNNSTPDNIQDNTKTRKKREELSVSACKCIKKETVKIIVKFN
jgi:iron uptake system EfeUOB component EfeO/EfeM